VPGARNYGSRKRYKIKIKNMLNSFNAHRYKLTAMALKANTVEVKLALLGLLFMTALLYLMSVNSLSTQGFKIKKMNTDLGALKKENLELSFSLDTQNSAQIVMDKAAQLGLEHPAAREYVLASSHNVALSR